MKWYLKIIPLLFILILWELAAILLNNPFILPHPSSVASVLLAPTADILGSGSIIDNALLSIWRVLLGFGLAAACAVPLGIIIGNYRTLEELVNPIIQLFRPIPPLAWVPLALAWFKIGLVSIVFIIFIGSFFPILINSIDGVRRVNRTWIETARIYGAEGWKMLAYVILPAAAPVIWTGLRVGFGVAWMCVVAAEMLPGTTSGIGYLIMYSYNWGQVQVIIAGMIVIGIIGIGVDILFREIEKRKFMWQEMNR
ncbi:MAG: ABC transporter permease [Methanocalculus sp. MSAO_Arc1]|uniref:ABC transporter permease n=1 Tax=Methanocalculus TaxID=71151 RepID=UPI000FF30BFA|nr:MULTISPECIES: ABC transporter permease [unclassified Methanocalculus]MCP1663200.1 NitT/TauT family transport system permease protein [Methanocalculus sp. AMF5]RQD79716.1 MAG: ABC transporter permease [Methanocalculus sp. MSAO_Arc1]